METQHIKFVRRVAEHQNISAAARELGITQPALTKIVSRVEDLIGTQLFDRGPRGVVLTPMGQFFLDRMGRVEHEMDSLADEIRVRKVGISGAVTLAVEQFWLGRILPHVLKKLNKIAPDIQVRIITGPLEELTARVKGGDADILLGRVTQNIPEGFVGEKLADIRMFLVARSGHPLAGTDRSVEPEKVAEYGWVLPPRTDPVIQYAFTELGIEPPVTNVETVSRQLTDNLLEQTDFLTVFPGIKGQQINKNLTRIRADWLNWSSGAGVMLVKDRSLLPCCHKFLDALFDEFSDARKRIPGPISQTMT